MKISLLVSALGLSSSILVSAQSKVEPDRAYNFETLKLSSSPAFILLGVEPENIQRPGTPTAFITGLQNSISDNKIQPNLAFELSPYYMSRRDKNTVAERFSASKFLLDHPGLFKTIARTTTLSLGTSAASENSFGNLQKGTGLGLGLRFQIISGTPSRAFSDFNFLVVKTDALIKISRTVNSYQGKFDSQYVLSNAIQDYLNNFLPELKEHPLTGSELKKLRTELESLAFEFNNKGGTQAAATAVLTKKLEAVKILKESASVRLNQKKMPLAKQGFMLEAAAGQAYVFENDEFNSGRHAKSAIWILPSFRWDVDKENPNMNLLDIMFVSRYTFNNQSAGVEKANYLDAGAKLAFTRNKWSANAEFVYRYASNLPVGFVRNYTYRLVTGADYKISDAVTLKFSFGTNFDGNTATYTQAKKIFAIGGVNLGLLSFKSSDTDK